MRKQTLVVLGCAMVFGVAALLIWKLSPSPPSDLSDVQPETEVPEEPVPPEPSRPDPVAEPVKTLVVAPDTLVLSGPGDAAQLLVTKLQEDGTRTDVTSLCSIGFDQADPVVSVEGGYVVAETAGEVVMAISHGGEECTVKVEVGATAPPVSDFALDIVPILTKAGCNGGQCHGAAQGKGGLKLSLFGYDPESDFEAITMDLEGRRIDRLDPANSLVLAKPSLNLPHGGRLRLPKGSIGYDRLLRWIRTGGPQVDERRGQLVDIEVQPDDAFLQSAPSNQQLAVIAKYSDGSEQDVTRLSVFVSNDPNMIKVDKRGRVNLVRSGQGDVVVRYANRVSTVRVSAPYALEQLPDYSGIAASGFIDELVLDQLKRMRLAVSPRASADDFLRRIWFDLVGHMPDLENRDEFEIVEEFRSSESPDRRAKMIDQLLSHEDFVRFWGLKYAELFQINSQRTGNATGGYYRWLNEELKLQDDGKAIGYHELVRKLLTAEGSLREPANLEDPAVVYYASSPDPTETSEQIARRFLGLRIGCAKCHDHPLDVWTQDDYYGFASLFGGLAVELDQGIPQQVSFTPENAVVDPRSGDRPEPRFLDGDSAEGSNPRAELVDWMLEEDNPWFSRLASNWVWAHLMGRGIVEPVDDLRLTNPPVHPALLDGLAQYFRESEFDLRSLIKLICNSEAYQRSSLPMPGSEQDQQFYSHALMKPLNAQQMADAIAQVIKIPTRFGTNIAPETRALDLDDPANNYLLEVLGQCDRQNGCQVGSMVRATSLRQALHLIIGDGINPRFSDRQVIDNRIQNSLVSEMADATLDLEEDELDELMRSQIESIYSRAYCRKPNEEELEFWTEILRESESYLEGLEDMVWAVLNSREFAYNH